MTSRSTPTALTDMKRALVFLLALIACTAQAAHVSLDVQFTNRTVTGDAFTRNSTTVRYTNAPLNSTTWIVTNSPANSATGLWRHLGANMPQWYVRMTSPTNVNIQGTDAQFSITGTYALITTNSVTQTNGVIPVLNGDYNSPLKHTAATNQTNIANELAMLTKLRAADAVREMANSNNIYRRPYVTEGTVSNSTILAAPSITGTTITGTTVYASGGQSTGMSVSNAPWITGDSNRFGTVVIAGSLTASNASFPGTGALSQQIGAGADASGSQAIVFGVGAAGTNQNVVAVGPSTIAGGVLATVIGGDSQGLSNRNTLYGPNNTGSADYAFVFGIESSGLHRYSGAIGYQVETTDTNQLRLMRDVDRVSIPGELQADGTAKFASIVRSHQSGPWTFTEGAYTSLTGGSNNVVQASTNAGTRLSGHVSACNVNSLRTGDGLPMSGRRHWIFNGGSFEITLIDRLADGFETLATNKMALPGGYNITLPPNGAAELKYNSAGAYWEVLSPMPNTNLVVKTTGDFSGANTTNVVSFTGQQMQRMTNALSTNTVFIVSNVIAGASVELFLTGANGGVIASNYTFKVVTNAMTAGQRITWQTNGVALTNGVYDYAVPSNSFARVILTAPFTTNIFARYEVGP